MVMTWDELNKKIISEAKARKQFAAASFELTPRCNLQCKMCYVRSANDKEIMAKELTTAQWIRLAEEARDEGLLFLTLTGGEVLLREDFKVLYETLMKMGYKINIFTNGTLITPEIVNWLAAFPPVSVSITLYGASRETYKTVTGYAEAYDRVVRAIDILIGKGISTEIKTTVIQQNKHDFDYLHDFVLARNTSIGVVNYIAPAREGCNANSNSYENRLSPEELLRYEIHMTDRNQQAVNERRGKQKNTKIDDVMAGYAPEEPIGEKRLQDISFPFRCAAGSCSGWITWQGSLTPCGIMDKPQTFPLITGFKKAWEELKEKCAQIPLAAECQSCQYQRFCDRCPARLYRETGRYDTPAPYLCEVAKKRTEYNNYINRAESNNENV